METIDGAVHAWLPDCEAYPWDPNFGKLEFWYDAPDAPEEAKRSAAEREHLENKAVTAEDLLTMMGAVGIDAALIISPRAYADNHSYALDAAERHLGKFAVIGPVTPRTPNVEEFVRTYRQRPGALGIRLHAIGKTPPTDGAYIPIFSAAEKAEVPVTIHAAGHLPEMAALARIYPNLLFIVDHLGHRTNATGERNFNDLADLLALGKYENVALKWDSAPKYAREPYPYADLWPDLEQILEAFGVERVMWGTNITISRKESYCEALGYLRHSDRLTDSEKEYVLGKSLRTLMRWPSVSS